jgi:hypothetical protein
MRVKVFALLGLLSVSISVAVNAFADSHTDEQKKAAKEFSIEGIGLGASYSEIHAKFPDIEFRKDLSDPKVGLAVWRTYKSKTSDGIAFSLFGGKVYKIEVGYLSKTLTDLGGYKTVYDKLVAKYGKEDKSTVDEKFLASFTWKFYDVDRYIAYQVTKTDGHFVVMDVALFKQLSKKQDSNTP